MHAHIQYIAIRSHRPDELAAFYREYFAMDELSRSKEGDVALTDGFYNVSILKSDEQDPGLGYSHFGIAIDDIHEVLTQVERFGALNTSLMSEEGGPFHGEYRIIDPNGIPISLSLTNFGVPALSGERRLPAIRHIALSIPNQETVVQFFVDVFGFRRQVGTGIAVADGFTALQMLRYPVSIVGLPEGTTVGPRQFRFGLNHFGWLVSDLELARKTLPEGTVSQRPPRPMAEYRALDPDNNEFDLSQKAGYQVDADVWVRA